MAEVDTVQIPTVDEPVAGETVATLSKAIKTLGLPTEAKSVVTDTTSASQLALIKGIISILGEVAASPTSNTLLERIKALNTTVTDKSQLSQITDGTRVGTIKAASTAPGATDTALVVSISPNSVNANGAATSANSAPVVIASDQGWPVSTTGFMKKEDVASADGDAGIPAMFVRQAAASLADSSGTAGDYEFGRIKDGRLWVQTGAVSASAAFTPAATSHIAGDCNGAATEIDFNAPAACRLMITSATLLIDTATVKATGWRLHLYNVTPASAIADDSQWDLADADQSAYLGYIDLGTSVDMGTNQWVETNGINKQIILAGDSVFGYLVNNTTTTMEAVANTVTLHAVVL